MKEQKIIIRCKNNGRELKVPVGSNLKEIFQLSETELEYGPVCARVNNKVEGMNYRAYRSKDVEFLSLRSASGLRCYTRTLFFVLCKAVQDLFPGTLVRIEAPVSNGYYVDLGMGEDISFEDVDRIRQRMREIVAAAMPIKRYEVPTERAVAMFQEKGDKAKVKLLKSAGRLYTVYHQIEEYVDFYYGALLTNTSQLTLFGLEKYHDGLLLRTPSRENPGELGPYVKQAKMFEIFQEHHRWQNIMGVTTVGDFNEAVEKGYAKDMIHVSEALQEKKIAMIADEIAHNKNVRVVLLAGPSSSGKTTTCKRLAVQLAANAIKPIMISLDDYFVDRDKTPRDETGDYDFEHIHALNIPLINEQFAALFRGEEVQLPRYDFPTGKSMPDGRRLKMKDDYVLVVEGIHALNPELTAQIPEIQKFRVYASALTTIMLDNHNYIPTTDNRLLRRIVRDHNYRGVTAQETIRRWPSVRKGEHRWIFPFQENADAMFNTAMIYELAVLRTVAEPLLEQVPEDCEEYAEAYRLRKFLRYFRPLDFDRLPPTSLLREFLGGSSFKY